MIEKYGTDATRLSLLLGNAPGNDMKLSEEKIAGFRNFTNKLWNIARFIQTQIKGDFKEDLEMPEPKTLHDAWILQELKDTERLYTFALEKYGFSQAGELLSTFTWDFLADRYLEVVKVEGDKTEILNYVLNSLLKLWHPFMPFVTETIWQEFYGTDSILMIKKWPYNKNQDAIEIKFDSQPFETPKDAVNFIWGIISMVMHLRSENKIEPKKLLKAVVSAGDKKELMYQNIEIIKKLARLEDLQIELNTTRTKNSIGFVHGGVEFYVDTAGVVDVEKEKIRLSKELQEAEKYKDSLENKLSNKQFIQNAPEAVVNVEKEKMRLQQEKVEKLKAQLASL
jgi:valyl-tRNA synthetase